MHDTWINPNKKESAKPRPILLAIFATELVLAAFAQQTDAQTYTPTYAPAPPVTAYGSQSTYYSPEQLDQMLAPIALYPDPLLSQILAASTYPQDISSAEQLIAGNPNPSDDEINSQAWDPSIKALAHFPSVLEMLNSQMDWTEALGNAFVDQPQDVMDSIQRLRAKAIAAQTLTTSPQQQIVEDNGVIDILPAQQDTIYVPQYNPDIIYTGGAYDGPWITYSSPFIFGSFLDLELDFRNHRFYRGARYDWGHHRFDFDRGRPWIHDPHRPVPLPRHPFVPPRGPDIHRGWGTPNHPPGAFNPRSQPRGPVIQPRAPERPVTGLPRPPEHRPEPSRPVAPRVIPHPDSPRVIPHAPAAPVAPARPPRIERPVTGLPARPAPVARPAPRPAPVAPPAPRPAPSPGPAFHPGGGGPASDRGHNSMHR